MARLPDAARPRLRFLLDEGVPLSVGRALEEHGHEVIYLWEATPRGSDDPVVCAAALANDAILVALDGDMKTIARGHGISSRRFARLSLIKLSCSEPSAMARISGAMSLIESEWRFSEGKAARRLFVEIGRGFIKTNR